MNKIQGIEDEGVGSAEGQGKSTQASWLISVQEKSTKLLKALPLQVKPLIGNKLSNNDPIYRFLLREVAVAAIDGIIQFCTLCIVYCEIIGTLCQYL